MIYLQRAGLRQHQVEGLDNLRAALAADPAGRHLFVSPTAAGKSVVMVELAAERVARGERVLIVAHKDELIRGLHGHVVSRLQDPGLTGVVKAGEDQTDRQIVVASIATVRRHRRLERLGAFDLILVDEAHHVASASYRTLLDAHPGTPVVGFTATPFRHDRRPIGWPVAHRDDAVELLRRGVLCELVGAEIVVDDLKLDTVRVRGSDYDAGALAAAIENSSTIDLVVAAWQRECSGGRRRHTLVYAPSIEVMHEQTRAFLEAGISALCVWGSMPAHLREQAIADFAEGRVAVLVNVNIFNEGVDCPPIDCVALAAPTKSQGRYLQMIGRGRRLHPGKDDCLILDLVGAHDAHGVDLPTALQLRPGADLRRGELAAYADQEELDRAEEVREVTRRRELDIAAFLRRIPFDPYDLRPAVLRSKEMHLLAELALPFVIESVERVVTDQGQRLLMRCRFERGEVAALMLGATEARTRRFRPGSDVAGSFVLVRRPWPDGPTEFWWDLVDAAAPAKVRCQDLVAVPFTVENWAEHDTRYGPKVVVTVRTKSQCAEVWISPRGPAAKLLTWHEREHGHRHGLRVSGFEARLVTTAAGKLITTWAMVEETA